MSQRRITRKLEEHLDGIRAYARAKGIRNRILINWPVVAEALHERPEHIQAALFQLAKQGIVKEAADFPNGVKWEVL